MSRTYQFQTVDVFTTERFRGNQLGIVTIPKSKPLSQSEKQDIAIEFNYSETIFVHEPTPVSGTDTPHVKVDIFTPQSELPFAGHPTIGAVNHILTHVYPNHDSVIVDLKAGPVTGTLDHSSGFAGAAIPQEFHRHAKQATWDDVINIQPALKEGTALHGATFPVVSIVRGMNFGLIELGAAPELLEKIVVTRDDVPNASMLDEGWPATLFGTVFFNKLPEQEDGVIRINQRVIVINLEDPATGSASAALAANVALEKGGKDAVHKFELVQGEQMGRKSVIGVEVALDSEGTGIKKIVLSGQCKAVMKGELEV